MEIERVLLEKILPQVQKPARYLGTEWNAAHKNWDAVPVRMAFAFPDLYEVGMSHLGLQILYGLVNSREDYLMERAFTPAPDMERELRKTKVPLFSLESHKPLQDFDVIGFTLQYELTFTNVLNMLDLAGIPYRTRERGDDQPLIIAGGPAALNPEPLTPFIDAFLIGEGEEAILEILDLVREVKGSSGRASRLQLLERLVEIPGIYIPSFYSEEYPRKPLHPRAPQRVQRRVLDKLDFAYFPTSPLVPLAEAVHERGMVELFRGCTRGCRFCQAGMIYRPVRERAPEALLAQAEEIIKNTGFEELSLISLSSLDYSGMAELLPSLAKGCATTRTGLSLPSLRVDSFSVKTAKELPGRRTSVTLAPEAGSQRLRDVINKGVTENDLLEAVEAALEAGWFAVKLYFMVGLPTEKKEDLEGIADLVAKVVKLGKRQSQGRKRLRVTVSASTFVPKAHTPFQWEGQDRSDLLEEKHQYLRTLIKKSRAEYNWHNIETSMIEACFARGGREMGAVLEEAFLRGCRLDSWTEHFNYQAWLESFEVVGIDPADYATRCFDYDDLLPWEVIDPGVSKDYLISEHRKAMDEKVTVDCRDVCGKCGVCSSLGVTTQLARGRG
ncbi:MAG: TIGR03960 family B12-binding radical SAM protein [Syntrophaceticus sp.]|nr:TIGR03960 family B12-binding radical SAM protein [Syntrophaceticus sp.]MDD3314248.1 TIGR03960 family B12-binding radical SAM protein [Syntrophaceticus sp.]MDD4359843.1 TIGR03960 family B12-binding radical SAM protein [Syntrophaceticus sp.]MDD4782416.1 TIGR03960 family B12-binding radical SAM protein [Syntrophaceticus sp.]